MDNKWTRVTLAEVKKWKLLNKKIGLDSIVKKTHRNYETIIKWFKKIHYTPKKFYTAFKKYSPLEIKKIHSFYMSDRNIALSDISKIYGIGTHNLRKRFKKLNLPTKDYYTVFHRDINDNFFNKIDSEIKAYLLGFFAADGHISKCRLKIAIHKKDVEILHLFNKYIAKQNCDIIPQKQSNQYVLQINSKQISMDLKKLGYDNRKTYTCKGLPKISKKLMRHFIRGYFDGDGSINFSKLSKGGYSRVATFSAHKKNILIQIVKELSRFYTGKVYYYTIKPTINCIRGRKFNSKVAHRVYIGGISNLTMIYEYLYKNSRFYLKRKRETFKMCIVPIKKLKNK